MYKTRSASLTPAECPQQWTVTAMEDRDVDDGDGDGNVRDMASGTAVAVHQ